jgi:cellulose synthase/poly-beta-1,6-N-acetylglucosamine synthase-like glycosyltransferase
MLSSPSESWSSAHRGERIFCTVAKLMITNLLFVAALASGAHIVATWLAAVRRGIAARSHMAVSTRLPDRWPFVSVIVPAWCERGTLDSCIRTLRDVEYPVWEAIIVAGGPDGTYWAALESSKDIEHIQVLEQLPHGKNAALNQGLCAARGEVIVVLDADSQVVPGWLRALVAPIGRGALATTGNPLALRPTPIALGEKMEQIAAWNIRGAITLQGSGSIAVDRTVIEQIGGFPEEVLVGVDWDLDARLAACGVPRAVCPQAEVYTERPATLPEYWRNEVRWRRAHLASVFRLSGFFLANLVAAGLNLYIYALAWFSALFTLVVCALALTGTGDTRIAALGLWVVFSAWVFLRRAALAVEVAVYMRDLSWLRLAWVPPLLLFVTLAAIIPATVTLRRNQAHFKGPRLDRYGDRAS